MFYAVKSINGKVVNNIFDTWEECKEHVLGNNCVYKSFKTKEECVDFLKTAPVNADNFGKGYISSDLFSKNTIYVKFKFNRFSNASNGFTISIYETLKGEKIAAKGYYLPSNTRLVYALVGHFEHNDTYGDEFIVDTYSEHVTDSKSSIITYLSSGIIKGIGEKKAELIYEKFGNQTMEVLEKTPDKLLMVKGISKKGLEKIKASYAENKGAREITSYLLQFGISSRYGMLLYNQYGVNAYKEIKQNPYLICNLRGLTFKDADNIAKKEGIPEDDANRVMAAIAYVLKQNEIDGHTGMECINFQQAVWKLLNAPTVTPEKVSASVVEAAQNKKIRVQKIQDKQYIFLPSMFTLEENIADDVVRITNSERHEFKADIKDAEDFTGKKFDDIQKKGIATALDNNITIITGGPGTGKTTVINAIAYLYEKKYPRKDIILLAPTGRAARRMTEASGRPSHTIHSYLHIWEDTVDVDDEIIIEDSLVIIDEFSMTDVYVARELFSAIGKGCTVVIVGDEMQLPSVGPGAVLKSLLECGLIPVVKLERIYRQDEESMIYENGQNIRNGVPELKNGSDFSVVEIHSMEDIRNQMAHDYVEYVKKYGLGNVMCLCPFREHIAGVNDMNTVLQDMLNPYDPNKKQLEIGKIAFREGDLVMHLANIKEASNGDIGFVTEIYDENTESEEMCDNTGKPYLIGVLINNTLIRYTRDTIHQLTLAYATTVHKSQGSEADAVVTCMTNFHKNMLYRNILLVAVTRGKKEVKLYGDRNSMNYAILNIDKKERLTRLPYLLKKKSGEFTY